MGEEGGEGGGQQARGLEVKWLHRESKRRNKCTETQAFISPQEGLVPPATVTSRAVKARSHPSSKIRGKV